MSTSPSLSESSETPRGSPRLKRVPAREPEAASIQGMLFESGTSLAPKNHENPRIKREKRLQLLSEIDSAPLNSGQRQMVEHGRGALLTLAGPGSGKTHASVLRIGHLVAHKVVPGRILAVTFSREAANNLKSRARTLLSPYTKGLPDARTLHSLGYEIVTEHAEALNYRQGVRVVPSIYQEQFLERSLEALEPSVYRELPGKKIEAIATLISEWKNHGRSPSDLIVAKDPRAPAYVSYQRLLQQTGFIDFDDQIRLAVVVLSLTNEYGREARRVWQGKYDYLLVDEGQDSNAMQEQLVRIIAERHGNICMVGDDDQAIYEWRGADVQNIRTFHTRHSGCKIAMLETNYRSTPEIVAAANSLVSHSTEARHDKVIRAVKPSGAPVRVTSFRTQDAEAEGIAHSIKNQLAAGARPGDIAIIVRDRYHSNVERILKALVAEKIPFDVWFKEDYRLGPVKRNAYSLIQAISDPVREEPSFLQLFKSPAFELFPDDYDTLFNIRGAGDRALWQVMRSDAIAPLSERGQDAVTRLAALVGDLHERVHREGRTEALWEIVFEGFAALYPDATKDERWNEPKTKDPVVKHLRKVLTNLERYIRKAPPLNKTLESYLHFQLVEIPRRIREGQAKKKVSEARKTVSVLTMHGSKGLEFPIVYIPAVLEGVIPSTRALEGDLERHARERMQRTLPGLYTEGGSSGVEQERRLFFVAITRPQEELRISFTATTSRRSREIPATPSRFIDELGGEEILRVE